MNFYIISIFLFVIGASIGSFVNVVALRWNTGLSFVKGKSRCLTCNQEIGGDNLIPVFSYIYLGGRCAHCKSRLSLGYILAEIVSGFLAIALYFKVGFGLELIVGFSIFQILLFIFIYDVKHKIIPDTSVFLFISLSLLYSYFLVSNSLFNVLFGCLFVPFPFFLIWLLSGGRLLGFGDVKFMVGMGILFGFKQGLGAVFISFWVGSLVIIGLFLCHILFKKGKNLTMKSEIPFAPFLVMGTFIEFFFHFNLW